VNLTDDEQRIIDLWRRKVQPDAYLTIRLVVRAGELTTSSVEETEVYDKHAPQQVPSRGRNPNGNYHR
jgi:hypothetical protein